MRIRHTRFAAALLLLCAACSPTASGGPEYVRELALIADGAQTQGQVQVPVAARAGQSFTVVVTTWGGSCRRKAPAEVSVTGLRADVTVYDLNPMGGPCDRAILELEHVVQLRFAQAGTATVRVHGRGLDAQGALVPVVIERTLTVQ